MRSPRLKTIDCQKQLGITGTCCLISLEGLLALIFLAIARKPTATVESGKRWGATRKVALGNLGDRPLGLLRQQIISK